MTALASGVFGYSQTYAEIFKAAAFDRESEDRMGYSVDISGNYAIIGTYGDDYGALNPNMGSAYIFEKTGIEDWTFVQKINNSDQDDYDRFGWSVAIHGELAVIGAYAEDEDANDENTLSKAGSVYIFERGEDGVWTEQQKLVASDRTAGDEFGWSVDIFDSTVVVGAHFEEHDASGLNYEYHAGSMYIFDRGVDGTWTQTQKIVPSDRADDHIYPEGRPDPTDEDLSDLFGGSVAIWGDYIVAGSHNHDYGPSGVGTGYLWNQGAAYIFERSGGVWTEVAKIQSNIRKAWDRFGYAVDIYSNLVVVGVYAEDESEFDAAPLMNAGGAYIFERDEFGSWSQIQKLDAHDRTAGDHFGRDVAIDGDRLVIGAEQEDLDGDFGPGDSLSNAGAAYIFEKDGDGVWAEVEKVAPSDRSADDYFGEAVAISEYTVLAGAWQQDYDSVGEAYTEDAGAAYFFSAIVCETVHSDQELNICEGDSVIVGSSVYYTTGIYTDTLLTIDACDSVVTTDLTMFPTLYEEQELFLCEGASVTVGENTYDETGVYIDTLAAITGCDSIVTTNLTVYPVYDEEQELTICYGTSVTVGDNTYDASGTYEDVLETIHGCDSIVTTVLTVEPPITHEQEIDLCFGEVYEIGTSTYTESGTYEDTLSTDSGCDSIVTTILFIEDEILTEQDITLCAGETLTVGESTYSESGEYEDILTAISGCDSTVITNLVILPAIAISIEFLDEITLQGGDTEIETTTFQWITCEPFEEIDGATEQTYTATENGEYAVIITDGECIDTSDCVTVNSVGINTNEPINFVIYPNPNNGQFTIDVPSANGFQLTIMDNLGAVVYAAPLTKNKTFINLDHLAKGIYFVQLSNGENRVIKKISIQ